jgi:beta-N-acetylhexosaminidase
MKRKAIIISLSTTYLTSYEKRIIKKEKPWGIILFKRNIISSEQIINLIKSIKMIANDKKFPILVDEEGGRVTRLTNLIMNQFSQKYFGDLFDINKQIGLATYKSYIKSVCKVLKNLGININTIPVLDLKKKITHKIIGDRSYSNKISSIKALGTICNKIYKKNKLGTVIKHIPGHGSAKSDSHLKLPIVNDSFEYLKKNDFKCFQENSSFFAMTAHILYKKIDSKNVSTHSKKIIGEIIRKHIKFKGLIISDDISMKALKYDIITNAKMALNAGCNLVLYCEGKTNVSEKLLKSLPYIDLFTKKKTSEFYKFLS